MFSELFSSIQNRSDTFETSVTSTTATISNTYPKNIVLNSDSVLEHEATVSKINEEKLFYLMSKGLSEKAAKDLFVLGFISDFTELLAFMHGFDHRADVFFGQRMVDLVVFGVCFGGSRIPAF